MSLFCHMADDSRYWKSMYDVNRFAQRSQAIKAVNYLLSHIKALFRHSQSSYYISMVHPVANERENAPHGAQYYNARPEVVKVEGEKNSKGLNRSARGNWQNGKKHRMQS